MYKIWQVRRDDSSPINNSVVDHGTDEPTIYATFLQLAGKNPLPDQQRYVMTGPDHTILFAG
jgi:hypothetical protein